MDKEPRSLVQGEVVRQVHQQLIGEGVPASQLTGTYGPGLQVINEAESLVKEGYKQLAAGIDKHKGIHGDEIGFNDSEGGN